MKANIKRNCLLVFVNDLLSLRVYSTSSCFSRLMTLKLTLHVFKYKYCATMICENGMLDNVKVALGNSNGLSLFSQSKVDKY